MLNPKPTVSYISSDPAAGRLIRPCKCKGSSRYVHEGCLQAWRHADKRYSRRNYFECPTCGFRYQLDRVRWARWISSTLMQVFLTIIVMIAIVFVCGFIADPVLDLILGPIELEDLDDIDIDIPEEMREIYISPWTIHFIKGIASIGMFSVFQAILTPSFLWHMGQSFILRIGGGGGRRGGRERMQYYTLTLLIAGLVTVVVVSPQGICCKNFAANFSFTGRVEISSSLEPTRTRESWRTSCRCPRRR